MKETKAVALAAGAALLLLPAVPLAHAGGHDARGTVKELTEERIVLTTVQGREEAFLLGEDTRFERGHAPARREDVRVGERAVVHGRRDGKDLRATTVRLAPAGGAPKKALR